MSRPCVKGLFVHIGETRFAHLQATYSPLQGTHKKSTVGQPLATSSAVTELQGDHAFGADSHRIWLDAFVFSPLPAFVVTRSQENADGHAVLLANTAAVMMTGCDIRKLQLDTLESCLNVDPAIAAHLARSSATGCEFTMALPEAAGDEVSGDRLVAMPISSAAAGADVIGHLVVVLQGPGVQQLCGDKLATMPSVDDLAGSNFDLDLVKGRKTVRKGLLVSAQLGGSAAAGSVDMQTAQWALTSAFDAAAMRRDDGNRPITALPAALDPVAWLGMFELCLTSTMRA